MSGSLSLTIDRIENTIMKVCDFVESQKSNASDWKNLHEKRLWLELVSCILGSRVHYETAKTCAVHLNNVGLLEISSIMKMAKSVERKIRKELQRPIYPPFSDNVGSRYRYPNSRSRYILSTASRIYGEDDLSIKGILQDCHNGIEARDVLIEKCKGIGPKQASLFLRNIRFSDDLAILDCHVNRYMSLMQLNDKYSMISKERAHPYFKRENILRLYAISKKRSLATLDIGIWTVMRLIEKEEIVA
jgi:N-glycosylase/DNA lyase